jgi:hypothetical protein
MMIGHDIAHCHCARCERLNRSEARRIALSLAKFGPAIAFGLFLVYHLIAWAATGFAGFNRIGGG